MTFSATFSVGDAVTVRVPPENHPSAVLQQYQGRSGTVAKRSDDDLYPFVVDFGNELVCSFSAEELSPATPEGDSVNHPSHYTWLPEGLEVIDITKHFNFVLGNVLKYIFRAGRKGSGLEDLKKARWYLDFWIKHLEKSN